MKMRKNSGIIVATVLLMVTNMMAADVTLTATRDSYIQDGQPNSNFGSLEYFLVKNDGGNGYTRHSYITFDLSGLTGRVASVTLSVAAQDAQTGGSTTWIEYLANGGNESWDENTITWNNKPAAAAIALGSFSWSDGDPDGTWYSYSGQNLIDAVNADTNGEITFVLTGAIYDNKQFKLSSREHAGNNPKLEITYGSAEDDPSILTTSHDAYVYANDADGNYGYNPYLQAKSSGSYTRQSYIKFNLSRLTRQISGATLSVAAHGAQSGGGLVEIQYLTNGVDESWDENTITWNNKPAAAVIALGSFSWNDGDTNGTLYSYSGQKLINAINADTNGEITFFFWENGGAATLLNMSSREDVSNHPKLELTYVDTNTVVYTPSRDTYVDANDANGNFGSSDKMLVKNYSPYIRHAYIAFDISNVPPEYDGCILSGARLSVSAAGTQTGGSQVLVDYLTNGVDESWDENTITWNNKPAAAANLLGSFNWNDGDPDGTWYSYSGQNLIDAVNADTNGEITFVLTGGISENKMLFLTSKEGDGYYAKLELTYRHPQGTLIVIR